MNAQSITHKDLPHFWAFCEEVRKNRERKAQDKTPRNRKGQKNNEHKRTLRME